MFLPFVFLTAAVADSYGHRIIGGVSVDIKDFPYQVAVLLRSRPHCGGSIISERHVLSAAHCYAFKNRMADPKNYTVRANTTVNTQKGFDLDVLAIYNHPKFNTSVRTDNDIAVLKVDGEFQFGIGIQLVRLPDAKDRLVTGDLLNITGWGKQEYFGLYKKELQLITVPVIDFDTCARNYKAHSGKPRITDAMFCAGTLEGGQDSCSGDSGGPAVANGVIYGITSFGFGCALPNYPGIYANVSYLVDFVKEKLEL